MQINDRLKQIKDEFAQRLEAKKLDTALSFFNRCIDKDFKSFDELRDIQRTKEACDIAASIFQEIIDKTLGDER